MSKEKTSGSLRSFLSSAEREEFHKPKRRIERTISSVHTDPKSKSSHETHKLVSHTLNEMKMLNRREHKFFRCFCIAVRKEDGMTWSAESLNAALGEEYPHYNGWLALNKAYADSSSQVCDLIGYKTFRKLAVKHKIVCSVLSPWIRFGIVIVAIILGVAINFLQVIASSSTQNGPQGINQPRFYILLAVLAALGIVSQFVTNNLMTQKESKSSENFIKQLQGATGEEYKKNKHLYADFIESVAQKLQEGDYPRYVIIDNYESLDPIMRWAIEAYFEKHSKDSHVSEFWIIFEGQDGERFSNNVLEKQGCYGYQRTDCFQQLLLKPEEKLELVQTIGKGEEATEFTTIKSICHGKAGDNKEFREFLIEHRQQNPKDNRKYGKLEFLYLLSLTAGNYQFSYQVLVSDLARKQALRSEVLSQFLYGTNLRIDEFRERLAEIETEFRTMLNVEGTGLHKKLNVYHEITDVLTSNASKLQLPDSKLGHLFWGLYWYDKLQSHLMEAFWMRKLSGHLLSASAENVQGEAAYAESLEKMIDASLFAVDGCLQTCLFQSAMALLEKAMFLIRSDVNQEKLHQTWLPRMFAQCWKAYAILGEEKLLAFILDIYTMSRLQLPSPQIKDDVLEDLFFQSTTLSPVRRATLRSDFFAHMSDNQEIGCSISDFAKARSAWLCLTISPMVTSLTTSAFYKAAMHSDRCLQELNSSVYQRVIKPEARLRLTDMLTLSLALWCRALRFEPSLVNMRQDEAIAASLEAANPQVPAAAQSRTERPGLAEIRDLLAQPYRARLAGLIENSIENFSTLIDDAESAVILADDIRNKARAIDGSSLSQDFLMTAMARELCTISLASILTAYHYLPAGIAGMLGQSVLSKINGIIDLSNRLIDNALPTLGSSNDLSGKLIGEIDAQMKLCSIIWNNFQLRILRDFMSIRRLHFNAVCEKLTPDNSAAYEPLLEAASPAIIEREFTGIIANIAIAESLKQAADLTAQYLRQAGHIALSNDFADSFKREAALVVLTKTHSVEGDLTSFLHSVLEGSDEDNLISRTFKELPEAEHPYFTMVFLNASRVTSLADDATKVKNIVCAFADRIKSHEARERVQALVDLYSMEERLAKGDSIDLAALMSEWESRKNLDLYPYILAALLKSGHSSEQFWDESLKALKHDPSTDRYNSFFLLALTLIERMGRSGKLQSKINIPLSYLKNSIEKWKDQESAETNLRVFRMLHRYEENNKMHYFLEMQRWEIIKMRRDHFKRLPELVKQGQFFLVFQDYFESLNFWGLKTDLADKDLFAQIDIEPAEKSKRIQEWRAKGAPVPEPLARHGKEIVIRAEFLHLGHYLFSAPVDQDPTFDGERMRFNKNAEAAFGDLLKIITRLPDFPASIKDLLLRYSERLRVYTDFAE